MQTIINIPTWTCPECGYRQDFDPTDKAMTLLHHGDGNIIGLCPACYTGQTETKIKKKVKMIKEIQNDKKTKIIIEDELNINIKEIEETKPDGTITKRKLTKSEVLKEKQKIADSLAYWKAREDK